MIQLLINLTDINDNPPVTESAIYNATVMEEELPPLFVTKVSAKDADSGDRIKYNLVNDFDESFVIDENTGEISTNAILDREEVN